MTCRPPTAVLRLKWTVALRRLVRKTVEIVEVEPGIPPSLHGCTQNQAQYYIQSKHLTFAHALVGRESSQHPPTQARWRPWSCEGGRGVDAEDRPPDEEYRAHQADGAGAGEEGDQPSQGASRGGEMLREAAVDAGLNGLEHARQHVGQRQQ
jgi:hypothetical protein